MNRRAKSGAMTTNRVEDADFAAAPVGMTTGPVVPVPGDDTVDEGACVPGADPPIPPVAVETELAPLVAVPDDAVEEFPVEDVKSPVETLVEELPAGSEALPADVPTTVDVEIVAVTIVEPDVAATVDDASEVSAELTAEDDEETTVPVLWETIGVGVGLCDVDASAGVVVVVSGMGTAEVSVEPVSWLAVVKMAELT